MVIGDCGLSMAPNKDLASDVIAQIIGLKSAGHTITEICGLTGAGRTSVKKYVRRSQARTGAVTQYVPKPH